MSYPPLRAIKASGTLVLLAGLLLIAAVTLELVESILVRKEIWDEICGLDEETKQVLH